MILKMNPENGEIAVTVVRRKLFYQKSIDLNNYANPTITAVISCWKSQDGKLTSIACGKTITLGDDDEVRNFPVGRSFLYPNREEILLTRNWKRKVYFIHPERKPESVYRE